MKLPKKIEETIRDEAINLLEKGKPDWDIPHTLNAVRWIKKLSKHEGGDERILVPAMYLHDTGYPILKMGYTYEDMIRSKKLHAKRGASNAKKILAAIGGFSRTEIEKIAYLIANHDKHTGLYSLDRKLVFEADGLAQIDWGKSRPNFDRKNRVKFLKKYFAEERGADRWHTETGKKYLKILLKKAEEYNKNNP
jgi:hypothetical protein